MLVGSGVEDDLRMELAEDEVEALFLAHVADHRHEVECGAILFQAQAQLVHGGLTVVEEHQLAHAESGQLPAQLGADGTGGTGHHHHLVVEVVADKLHRDLDLFASEQVFDAHLTDRLQAVGLVDRGCHEYLEAAFDGQFHHLRTGSAQIVVDRVEQSGHAQLGNQALELFLVGAAVNLELQQLLAGEALVGRHEAHDPEMARGQQTRDDGSRLVAAAVDQYVLHVAVDTGAVQEGIVDRDHQDAERNQHEEGEQEIDAEHQAQVLRSAVSGQQQHDGRHTHLA